MSDVSGLSDLKAQPTEKKGACHLCDIKPVSLKAGLYLVATPIGNLRDISLRALDILRAADLIACEDTRVTGKLLAAFGLSGKLFSYNDHSDSKRRAQLVRTVREGKVVALVSDAGMPLISDPGYKLVRDMLEAGLLVSSVPGASAPLTALQLSGLPSDRFAFLGFLPVKAGTRQALLREWTAVPATLVAFETAPRLLKTLADLEDVMGGRLVVVARELTKMYEEVRRGNARDLIAYYEEHGLPKGEIVLVIAPPGEAVYRREDLAALLRKALETMGTKAAAAFVAEKTRQSRSDLYKLALEVLKNGE